MRTGVEPMQAAFDEHNAEVRQVWRTYREGDPVRVPMILGSSARFYLSNPRLNTGGTTSRRITRWASPRSGRSP